MVVGRPWRGGTAASLSIRSLSETFNKFRNEGRTGRCGEVALSAVRRVAARV